MAAEELHQEADGTWTIDVDRPDHVRILRGIPTKLMAEAILEAMHQMETCGYEQRGDEGP